ncbi:Transposase and inactivated derivatives [Mycobacteroides abscessus subsp. abscessus]|nr:Transposase and inactivated derivatives [Mycobacteroides abscessus subsp. abscessus]
MPRKRRIWYPGASFHITSRGIRRTSLFWDEEDREEYLRLLVEVMAKRPFILQTYCLMTNHIHLQIKTLQHSPSNIMQLLHFNYAKYFNKKYEFTGHVFESRYGSELITSAQYELEVNRYIHLNPIRAGMVETLEEYPWSSYFDYIVAREGSFVNSEQILAYFPEPQIEHYLPFLYARGKEADQYPI